MPHPFLQFPQLLYLAFFVPLLLRVVAAASFGYIAYIHFKRRETLAEARVAVVGRVGGLIWLAIVVEAGMALCLLFGYYAQTTALLGLAVSLKHFIFAKKYPRFMPLGRAEYVYLFVICLSILLLGAGAFALDLPL